MIAIVRIEGAPRGRTGVLEVEIVLVLDTQEVKLKAGEIVVQRGTTDAWSNRLDKPGVLALASHDGKY